MNNSLTDQSWIDQTLTFIYTLARWLGELIVSLVNTIVPQLVSADLIDPIGYLALLTIVVVLVSVFEALRKLAGVIIGLGWLLIILRIVLDKLKS